MNRILGRGDGIGLVKRMLWIVGTAVYQVHLVDAKSCQKRPAENFPGMTTLPLDRRGASKPASRPWTWKSGMTR